jgi:hypothetical protein
VLLESHKKVFDFKLNAEMDFSNLAHSDLKSGLTSAILIENTG